MGAWNGSAWLGIEIGPEPLRHEWLGVRGVTVRECAVCGATATVGGVPLRITHLLVRPAARATWEGACGFEVVPPAVAGWVTSCHHVVWAGLWELVYPGPQRVPRWERRSVPSEQRDQLRRAAFAVGADVWIGTREPAAYAGEVATERLYGKMTEPEPELNELDPPPGWSAEDALDLVLETSSVWVTGAAFPWPGVEADDGREELT